MAYEGNGHLTVDEIQVFIQQKADDVEQRLIEAHVVSCPTCEKAMKDVIFPAIAEQDDDEDFSDPEPGVCIECGRVTYSVMNLRCTSCEEAFQKDYRDDPWPDDDLDSH